ncbi:hypothetical protein IWZ00DRAFT_181585 [Phyllosticta capitalensis]|uniref:ABM domain-containing protein n=1 Tax=Phyllosticta capitalensis TaxID=121624 RepID=A0ABR1YXQ4_9PEZI
MPNVIENAIIPLRSGVDLESADSPDAQAWRQTLTILSEQPGCVRLATGLQVENPDTMQMLIEWKSVEDHARFMAAPAYTPFFNNIKGIMSPTAAPILTHHALAPDASAASSTAAPVTELVSFYFAPDFVNADFDAPVAAFADAAAAHAKGLHAYTAGWAVEEDVEHASLAEAGGKGKLWLLVVGWDSIDAHMAYRQTQAFRDTIGGLRAKSSGVEMHHVVFKEFSG